MGSGVSVPRNDYELCIVASKTIEEMLEAKWHVQGMGIHEKLNGCESKLPAELVKKLRYLGTMRNKLVHEREVKALPDRDRFVQFYRESVQELTRLGCRRPEGAGDCVIS